MDTLIITAFFVAGSILSSSAQLCTHGSVRLVGSSTSGRLEVCNRGVWGTVCDDLFSNIDARVVCIQLGFSDRGAVALYSGIGYRRGSFLQSIFLDNIQCSGTEDSLFDCNANPIGTHNCIHREDVGVRCTANTRGDIRLRGRQTTTSGRVEVYSGTAWGTVCDDNWSSNDARVACRQLGLSTIGATPLFLGSGYTRLPSSSPVPIILDDLLCTGTESRLFACRHRGVGVHNCNHREDAGVQCGRAMDVQDQEIGKVFQKVEIENAEEFQKKDVLEDVIQQEVTPSDQTKDIADQDTGAYAEVMNVLKKLMEEK